MKNLDYIKMTDTGLFRCAYCDDTYQVNMPAPRKVIEYSQKAWKAIHKTCTKPVERDTNGKVVHPFVRFAPEFRVRSSAG